MKLRTLLAALLLAATNSDAMSQAITRICVQSVGAGGQNNCVDSWAPGQQSALSNTATNIKTSAGQLGNILCYNPNTSVAYVQFFNSLAVNVTLGTTVPIYVVSVPPSLNGGFAQLPGIGFSTAISFAATTTATGSTANSTALTCSYGYN